MLLFCELKKFNCKTFSPSYMLQKINTLFSNAKDFIFYPITSKNIPTDRTSGIIAST